MKTVGKVVIKKTFKRGDLICALVNFANDLRLFFRADSYDVENYSGTQDYLVVKFTKEDMKNIENMKT